MKKLVHTVVKVLNTKDNSAIAIFIVTKEGDVHVEAVDSSQADVRIYGSDVGLKR